MCFGGGEKEDVEGANKSREIDKLIRQDEKKLAREVKLLLLGEHQSHRRSSSHHNSLTVWRLIF